ncbi:hypothetical protein ONS95_007332 [Cadophora gregata]|uniref:uncharacterized protein n=1 Tax=Cadophora gregata TaxID=51156 RepID=UPI0026DAF4D5|nr:uncharacterized protein ONS95_007332 [Cadophora gregata]KAK0100888.1 hypothetical protein ONS95_007332 [Cadophora gregata]KAK0117119.1 hypothetical protein ONS96_012955 [Cadophora gregata f. sp. sojae]
MSKATNTKLMDTEPGGENTQYESQDTFTKSPKKSTGQFGATAETEDNEADVHRASQKAARGEKTAENVRFGEAISEHGFGGETVGNTGRANNSSGMSTGGKEGASGRTRRSQGSFGEGMDSEERVRLERARREMGYEEGSGVGG